MTIDLVREELAHNQPDYRLALTLIVNELDEIRPRIGAIEARFITADATAAVSAACETEIRQPAAADTRVRKEKRTKAR